MKKMFFFWATILLTLSYQVINAQIVGAELSAHIPETGKLNIVLQTFYESSDRTIPSEEVVSILIGNTLTGRNIFLKKSTEVIKVPDGLHVNNSQGGKKPEVPSVLKAVQYLGVIDLKGDEETIIAWRNDKFTRVLNNVDLGPKDNVVLQVKLSSPGSGYNFYSTSFPDILNANKVSSQEMALFPVTVPVINDKAMQEIKFSTPYIQRESPSAATGAPSSMMTDNTTGRPGYTKEQPAGKTFAFDPEKREMHFDHMPPGKYLLAVDIRDYRNTNKHPLYQGVFLIESTL